MLSRHASSGLRPGQPYAFQTTLGKLDQTQTDAAVDASLAITKLVEGHAAGNAGDLRQPLRDAIKDLNPDQLRVVLEAGGSHWMRTLLGCASTDGSRQFFDLVGDLVTEGKFKGDVGEVFSHVVPELSESNDDSLSLMRFAAMVTKSSAIGPVYKDRIIWGSLADNPTLDPASHWAVAARHDNPFAQAALLAGVVMGADGDGEIADRLLPADTKHHVVALERLIKGQPKGEIANSLYLGAVRQHLDRSSGCTLS
jgi:hypothetical protein